jgi:hypothetical protein
MKQCLRLHTLIAVFICLFAGASHGAELRGGEFLVVGAYVNGANGRDIDVYRVGEIYWMPVETLSELTGFRFTNTASGITLSAPIGVAEVPAVSLSERDGVLLISSQTLMDALKIMTRFDSAEFALRLDVPWSSADLAAANESKDASALEPDVHAPSGSLSLLRFRSDYSRAIDSGDDFSDSTLDVGGRAGVGTWMWGARKPSDDDYYINRYFWNHQLERTVYRLGTNFVDLNPLVDSINYTGLQFAWNSNSIEPFTDFSSDLAFDSFLSEDVEIQRDIVRADGPPGGIAELRINDRPLNRVRVDLNGNYEFRNLPLPVGDFSKVEIYLYARSVRDEPAQIVDLSRQLVAQTLPRGETLLRAGGGGAGNPLNDESQGNDDGDATGFVQARYGLSEDITLQAIAQQDADDTLTIVGGVRTSLGKNWAVALDLSSRDGSPAANAQVLGGGERWDTRIRSRFFSKDYGRASSDRRSQYDNVINSFYEVSETLRAGVVGRYYRDSRDHEVQFLKPAAYWNPTPRLNFGAVPNLDGDYRLSAAYRFAPAHRLNALYDNQVYSAWHTYNRSSGTTLQSGYDYSEDEDNGRVFSQASVYIDGNFNNYLQAGLSYNEQDLGYFMSWNRILRPGVEFGVSAEERYRLFNEVDTGLVVAAFLRLDFAAVGGRLAPTDNRSVNFTRGGVAGAIQDSSGKSIPVDNVNFLVNGQRLPQSQSGGDYYLRDLKPGVYEIAIDEFNLPLEYVPVRKRQLVEVGRASVTEANFEVRVEYGAAGQVTDSAGEALRDLRVVAIDASGEEVSAGQTDQFGYFRLDRLLPGSYRFQIRSTDEQGERIVAERLVEIRDNFLFDQDLVVN